MTYQQAPDLQRVTRFERFAQKHRQGIEQLLAWTFLIGFAALNAFILVTQASALASDLEAINAPMTQAQVQETSSTTQASDQRETAKSGQPDPCGLKDVVCPGETNVINATVYAYQAVPSQTDSTPCEGAMPGVDFCNPMGNIVANNCLPLGSYVGIRGDVYYVADRMASRYGCDVFDILIGTNDEPFKLTNEPVQVL